MLTGNCRFKHDYIGPFDTEFEVTNDFEDRSFCQTVGTSHEIVSFYSSGDRAFLALDYEGEQFHQPLRVFSDRVQIP